MNRFGCVFALGLLVLSSCAGTGETPGGRPAQDTGLAPPERKAQGYLLGTSSGSVLAVSVDTGAAHYLVEYPSRHTDVLNYPAINTRSKTLFYVNRTTGPAIMSVRSGEKAQVIYPLPEDQDGDMVWLLPSTDGRILYYCLSEGGPSTVMAFDCEAKRVRQVYLGWLCSPRPEWLDDTHLLVAEKPEGPGEYDIGLAILNVQTGELKRIPLTSSYGWFALSEDKTRLCVQGSDRSYIIREYPSLKVIRTIRYDQLPGKYTVEGFCFVGNRHLAMYRATVPSWFMGNTYLVDIEDKDLKARRLIGRRLESLHYVPEPLEWKRLVAR